jgi:hypothetical protein
MTFEIANWAKTDSGFPYTVAPNFKYQSDSDTLADIVDPAYFDDVVGDLKKYSFIEIVASDDIGWYYVTSETGATPVGVASIIDASIIPDGSITNAKVNAAAAIDWSKMAALTDAYLLVGNDSNVATPVAMSGDAAIDNTGATTIQANAIELGMLAAGITPSHVVKYAGEHTTVGGSATEAITVTGVLATDLVLATLHTAGATPRTIVTAVASADTVTITFSGDPSTDHVVTYTVLRAAA